ncbi:hypothetical protein LLEC1_05149 [Akanthomyces lecanii]|uniref:Cytochrome b5 heme-binding domain-containing protein n=1 Tax=Cordyceps confragosa TaxID=2714763 RepID=A0A179IAP5_CORDF|nr:hypothetical protein LLEC1_05149 [Akanthomyces lecanii]
MGAAKPETAEYTARDVAAHNQEGDLWIVIQCQGFYDVTKYAQDHPGGTDVMVEMAGQDASEEFESAAHSDDAFEIMETFRIGRLKIEGQTLAPRQVRLATPSKARAQSGHSRWGVWSVVLIGVVFALSVAYFGYLGQRTLPGTTASNPPELEKPAAYAAGKREGYGFGQGVFCTVLAFSVAAGISLYHLSVILNFGTKPGQYPAHLKLPRMPQGEKLN